MQPYVEVFSWSVASLSILLGACGALVSVMGKQRRAQIMADASLHFVVQLSAWLDSDSNPGCNPLEVSRVRALAAARHFNYFWFSLPVLSLARVGLHSTDLPGACHDAENKVSSVFNDVELLLDNATCSRSPRWCTSMQAVCESGHAQHSIARCRSLPCIDAEPEAEKLFSL